MQGTAGDDGDPKAKDPVDRVSSRVQAVVCFYLPTSSNVSCMELSGRPGILRIAPPCGMIVSLEIGL
jgi:hypothetical protein